MANRF